jgi:hypothetical protein
VELWAAFFSPGKLWLTQSSKLVAGNFASRKVTPSMSIFSTSNRVKPPPLGCTIVCRWKDVSHGNPLISGAKVTAEVVEQRKDKKVVAFKYKRRKGYHRTVGHRRKLTRVKIKALV